MSATSSDLLHQASAIWKVLDELAARNPRKYFEFIKKTLNEGEEAGLGPPEAFKCLQTFKEPKLIPVKSFFINICKWKQIKPPASSQSPISMTISDTREESVNGNSCIIVDVASNPSVLNECFANEQERQILVELILKYVEEQKKLKLSRAYTICNESYVGNEDNILNFMCPGPLLAGAQNSSKLSDTAVIKNLKETINADNTEIKCSKESRESQSWDKNVKMETQEFLRELSTRKSSSNSHGNRNKALARPEHEMSITHGNDSRKQLKVTVKLRGVLLTEECELDVSEEGLELTVPNLYELHVEFPVKIMEDSVEAIFVKDDQVLYLTMTIDQSLV